MLANKSLGRNILSKSIEFSVLKGLIQGGIEYGLDLLVEFEPQSIWYETSLNLAADALVNGVRTDYHTFVRDPNEARMKLAKLGLDIGKLEEQDILRIIDSYTVQTGLGVAKTPKGAPPAHVAITRSLKVSDLSIEMAQGMKNQTYVESNRKRLHIDDNSSVYLQYNEERALIDFYRTRLIPLSRAWQRIGVHSFVAGVHSDGFYRQLESLCDGIVDLKAQETGGRIEHLVRVRSMRGRTYDSRWHKLQLLEMGEVKLIE